MLSLKSLLNQWLVEGVIGCKGVTGREGCTCVVGCDMWGENVGECPQLSR